MIGSEVINKEAWEKFSAMGLPTRKNEHYRYVRLPTFSFEKGVGNFEVHNAAEGVLVLPFPKAQALFGALLQSRFERWLRHEKDAFACLNGAICEEERVLYVPPGVQAKEMRIDHSGDGGLLVTRLHFYVGKGAELSITLSQKGKSANRFLDFTLEEGARVEVRMAECAEQQIDTVRASLKRDSYFKSVNCVKGCPFLRQDYAVALLGESSYAELYGVCELEGTEQAHTNALVEHIAPNTASSQKFKGVVDGKGRTSFEGKIYVHPQAQQTNAYQMSNYLVLSPKATANSKPNLEIFADDVKASHGATVGQIDSEHLFYLQSRGIAKEEARRLLIQGFVQEIYDHLS